MEDLRLTFIVESISITHPSSDTAHKRRVLKVSGSAHNLHEPTMFLDTTQTFFNIRPSDPEEAAPVSRSVGAVRLAARSLSASMHMSW